MSSVHLNRGGQVKSIKSRLATKVLGAGGALALAVLLVQCNSSPSVTIANGNVSGLVVVTGPVSGASLSVFRFNGADRAALVGTGSTAADGTYSIDVHTSGGPFLVAATGGSFTDVASRNSVRLNGNELTALVPVFNINDKRKVTVSPISQLAATLALTWVRAGQTMDDAGPKAVAHINTHFGGIDWTSVVPTDLTVSTSAQLDDGAKAGVILAGLSMEAKIISDTNNAGGAVDALTLTETLAQDLAGDALFNGQGAQGQLTLPPTGSSVYKLDGQTVRNTLSQGITRFLQSSRNVSGITPAAAQGLIQGIGIDSDPLLFVGGSSGGVDTTPPLIQMVSPHEGDSLTGDTIVEATATDDNQMGSLTFTAPNDLKRATATSENGGRTLRLRTTLTAGLHPDGPLTITVAALDAAGNLSAQDVHVAIANNAPTIQVNQTDGATVKGTVKVSATATTHDGGTITRLILVSPQAGISNLQNPTPSTIGFDWDTTTAPEGPAVLKFHAEDSIGAKSDSSLGLTVSNYALGSVTAVISAGNPVKGASLTINAWNDGSAAIDPVVGALGQCPGPSDAATGTVSCTLTKKNWNGPIQVVATGTTTTVMTYTDASDGTTVTVPQSFQFTSFVANYSTNVAGNQIKVPVTLWTTLADQAALAYAQGKNKAPGVPPGTSKLTAALAQIDPLFEKHVSTNASPGWHLRSTFPAPLAAQKQSPGIIDVVLAAMPDLAINQLAHDLGKKSNVNLSAVVFTQSALDDVSYDGQFDGIGLQGAVKPTGTNGQPLDSNTLRYWAANGLNEWFRGPTNVSGISTDEVYKLGIYDDLSKDTSILFGASPAPLPFDNTPPTVTFDAKFQNGSGPAQAPVPHPSGKAPLVSGTLSLMASAIDAESQVTQLSILAGSTAVVSYTGLPSSSAVTINGTYDTRAANASEGPLTFIVNATDSYGNNGKTPENFTLDNTPPTFSFNPGPPATFADGSFYSNTVPVDVAAQDANGVQSTTVTGLPGFSNQSGVPSRVSGTWSIPTKAQGQQEVPVTATFSACDLVNNCASSSRTFTVDRTAPKLAWVTPPPRYTSQSSVNMTVSADDGTGSGVSMVYAQVFGGTLVPGTQKLGTNQWTFSVPLNGPSGRDNVITVYGVDKTLDAANSGLGGADPFLLTANSMFDNVPPVISPSAALLSYYDESGMQLSLNPGADANLVSAWAYNPSTAYNPSGIAKTVVDLSTNLVIRKSSTRLGWYGAGPPNDLSGANSTNTASIAYDVADNGGSGVQSASFTATVSCTGCPSFSAATGSLLKDTDPAHPDRYLLPVTSDTIPALAQVASVATVGLTINATDWAGNPKQLTGQQFQFQIVAPAVSCRDDATFQAGSDPRRASAFQLINNTYPGLFQNNTYPTEAVRFARYVCYNPAGAPLALAPQLAGEGSHGNPVVERWEASSDYAPGQPASAGTCYDAPNAACGDVANPCTTQGGGPVTRLTAGGIACGVAPSTTLAPETQQDTWALSTAAYQVGASIEQPATLLSNGAILVPAASNGVSGRIAVYLTVPNHSVPSLTWDSASGHYQTSYANYDGGSVTRTSPCTCTDPSIPCPTNRSKTCYASSLPWFKYLSAADSKLFGTLAVTTTSLNGTSVTGSSSTSSLSFSRSIPH